MRKPFVAIVVVLLVVVLGANVVLATAPTMVAESKDPRNNKVQLISYYRFAIDPTTLVLDLWNVSDDGSMADVDRVLLDTAQALQTIPFEQVELSFRGNPHFVLPGDYFRQLGRERDWQNPAYTMRTLPENVLALDGSPAFGQWTGGMLAVVSRQLQDHNDFHHRWWLDSWVGSR
jgi:hypothetical protein